MAADEDAQTRVVSRSTYHALMNAACLAGAGICFGLPLIAGTSLGRAASVGLAIAVAGMIAISIAIKTLEHRKRGRLDAEGIRVPD